MPKPLVTIAGLTQSFVHLGRELPVLKGIGGGPRSGSSSSSTTSCPSSTRSRT